MLHKENFTIFMFDVSVKLCLEAQVSVLIRLF